MKLQLFLILTLLAYATARNLGNVAGGLGGILTPTTTSAVTAPDSTDFLNCVSAKISEDLNITVIKHDLDEILHELEEIGENDLLSRLASHFDNLDEIGEIFSNTLLAIVAECVLPE